MNYDEQFHYKDLRSGQLTNGIERGRPPGAAVQHRPGGAGSP